jgi:hypothetical protein
MAVPQGDLRSHNGKKDQCMKNNRRRRKTKSYAVFVISPIQSQFISLMSTYFSQHSCKT